MTMKGAVLPVFMLAFAARFVRDDSHATLCNPEATVRTAQAEISCLKMRDKLLSPVVVVFVSCLALEGTTTERNAHSQQQCGDRKTRADRTGNKRYA